MNNTTQVPNQKVRNLKYGAIILTFIGILYVFVVLMMSLTLTKNLNGEVISLEVTVKEILSENDTPRLVDSKNNEYMISGLKGKLEWESLVGRTITLIIPADQFSGDPWILGVLDGDDELINFEETIKERRADNTLVVAIFGTLTGLFFVGAVICFAIYRNKPKMKTQTIDECVWEVFGANLPKSPMRKKMIIPTVVWAIVSIVLVFLCIYFDDTMESETVGMALGLTASASLILGIVCMLVFTFVFLPKEEIKFFKEKYPFNMDDVSHQQMKKSLKEEINQRNKEEREKHPDDFFEFGNGFTATFKEDGLFLFETDFEGELETSTQGVFDEYDDPNAVNMIFQYTIPYEKLNFIAIPKYRKYVNMFGIIIKSRLDGSESYPVELHFDVHFLLDLNLLTTLRKFNVEVENLDNLLKNIEKLMKENCKKAKSGVQIKWL